MRRRIWIWIAVAVVVVALGVVGVLVWRDRHVGANADCRTARELIAYNKSQGQLMTASFDPDKDREASVDDYRVWAGRLHTYSAQISAPDIAAPATRLAAEADQMVGIVQQSRASTSTEDPTQPPPWAQQYADLAHQFHDNLAALDRACPAQ
ncbi:hypothetical protein ACQ86B_28985 (plasmid) [Mycolicibacterium aichiense]|uniref:hypothetical protein n=1 Tax=Mycolicibacterium aichiense TaxID=1799 RepID=UPI003D66616F